MTTVQNKDGSPRNKGGRPRLPVELLKPNWYGLLRGQNEEIMKRLAEVEQRLTAVEAKLGPGRGASLTMITLDGIILHLSPAQCRTARVWLDWTQGQLAEAAGLKTTAISRFEAGDETLSEPSIRAIEGALVREGLRFFDTIDGRLERIPGILLANSEVA
jgi:hypothetical protein